MADLSWSSGGGGRGVTIAQNDISSEVVVGVNREPGVSSKARTAHVACPHRRAEAAAGIEIAGRRQRQRADQTARGRHGQRAGVLLDSRAVGEGL